MQSISNESISKLYLATFGRPLDSRGMQYWTNTGEFSDNRGTALNSLEEIAKSFTLQNEYLLKYPDGTTNEVFINSIYQNLFGREAEEGGLNYWKNELDSGNITRDKAILAVINGAVGEDMKLISNRTEVALYFSEKGILTEELAKSPSIIDVVYSTTSDTTSILRQKMLGDTLLNETHSNINDGIGELSTLDSEGVSALDSQFHWNNNDKEITYSFNQAIPDSYYSYIGDIELTNNWSELTQSQKDTVNSITTNINKLLDIKLVEVENEGDIQFNIIDLEPDVLGFSFYPSRSVYGGDIFLSQEYNNSNSNYTLGLNSGESGWNTIVHELGHSLGLKHPFEGESTLPTKMDNDKYTIMSYTSNQNVIPEITINDSTIQLKFNVIGPQLYSLYDISTLQAIYGANLNTNTQNNTYQSKYTDYKIETIWDAGGVDTINLSTTKGNTTLDLHGGTLNSVDSYSLEMIIELYQEGVTRSYFRDWIETELTKLYNEKDLYVGEDNFAIANGVIIENIYTGSGNDIITDNEVDNIIKTGAGDDKIYLGHGGYDFVDGGEDNDILYLELSKNEITIKQIDSENYNIMAENFEIDFKNIEQIQLNDNLYTVDLLIG